MSSANDSNSQPESSPTDTGDDVRQARVRANTDFDMGLRLGIAQQLGHSGFNERDRYDVFGWETDPDEEEYLSLYLRNAYARAVIDRPVSTTWRRGIKLQDGDNPDADTAFEDGFQKLDNQKDILSYLERVDRAAGVGEYALLFIDFDDVDDIQQLSEEATLSNADLDSIRGFRVFLQAQVENIERGDFGSGRWGEPEFFDVDFSEDVDNDTEDVETGSARIHHSRVVQVPATQLFDNENKSRPRLEPILNNLYDIEKVQGAVAESAYRGADYGLHLNADPTKVDISQTSGELRDELARYENDLQRYIRTQGMEVNKLGGEVKDPSGIIEAELSAIAAEKGMPKRLLDGSAAGELASAQQDTRQWFGKISERQEQYVEPYIYWPTIEKLIEQGILPRPETKQNAITWASLFEETETEQAEMEETRSSTIANLSQAPGLGLTLSDSETATFIKEGEFPDFESQETQPLEPPEEEEMQPQFEDSFEIEDGDGQDEEVAGNAEEIDLTPPQQAADNARRGLECVEEIDTDAGKAQGRDTARAIIDAVEDNSDLSEELVEKMAAFDRHRAQANHTVDEEHEGSPCEDNGFVSWKLWGGSAGVDWALGKNEDLDANAAFSEGDAVDTPDGIGVIAEVRTEDFDGPDGDVSASPDKPAYVVALEDRSLGAKVYRSDDLSEGELPETDVDDPVEDAKAEATTSNAIDTAKSAVGLSANDWTMPDSWRESDTPARIILLKAWAGMNGQFDCGGGCCKGEMMSAGLGDDASDEFCAAMKDEVMGGWTGWRNSG